MRLRLGHQDETDDDAFVGFLLDFNDPSRRSQGLVFCIKIASKGGSPGKRVRQSTNPAQYSFNAPLLKRDPPYQFLFEKWFI